MAILETEVLVNLNSKNVKHYEYKGYEIPRRIDKYGNFKFERGTKILVRVEDLNKSEVRVTKVCDDCGKNIPNQRYVEVIVKRKNGDGKDRCVDCASIKGGKTQKANLKYENSLEYWAKENSKEYLLSEFSSKNIKLPSQVARADNGIFWWDCSKCNSEYDMQINSRTSNGRSCPYCCVPAKKVNHTNCLWTTNPEVAKLLQDEQRGYEITAGSGKKEKFTCLDCGHPNAKTVQKVISRGFSCKRCSDGMKYPEKFMISVLSQLNIDFETQKVFDWSKNVEHEHTKLKSNKVYDFYIPSLNVIIETHGDQHYNESGFSKMGGRNLQEEQVNDEIKKSLALNGGEINHYITINCSESNMTYIKNIIKNSRLADLFDLSMVDYNKANEWATNSNLVKLTSDYWNSGIKSTVQIGKLMNLSRPTIIRYLKRATELSWVDNYDPKEMMRQSIKINGAKRKKEVVQLSLNGDFIGEWESTSEASRNLNIDNISSVCLGKRKTTGGFRWIYKEDYQKQLLQTS